MQKNTLSIKTITSRRIDEMRKLRIALRQYLKTIPTPGDLPARKATSVNNFFSDAAYLGKQIRASVAPLLENVTDPSRSNRMMKILMKGYDRKSSLHKNLTNTDLSRLKGFQFNARSSLQKVLPGPIHLDINQDVGKVLIAVPSLKPLLSISRERGSKYYQYFSACVEVNLEEKKLVPTLVNSDPEILTDKISETITMSHDIPPGCKMPVLIIFGIKFYAEHCGVLYPCNNCKNILQIIEVHNVKNNCYGT